LRAGRIATSPEEKRELLARACKLALAEGCTALGQLISQP